MQVLTGEKKKKERKKEKKTEIIACVAQNQRCISQNEQVIFLITVYLSIRDASYIKVRHRV